MANNVDPDQTAPIGAVCSGSTLFASILNSSVMLGNYLQQTTSADDIFRCIFFLGALRVNPNPIQSGGFVLFCCFTSQVNSYGHCGTVSSPKHTFSWAGLNKRLTSNLCTYFRL